MNRIKSSILCLTLLSILLISCQAENSSEKVSDADSPELVNPDFNYEEYQPNDSDIEISRSEYASKLYGFWLAQNIANWTGLVTEMDKIGNTGEIKTGDFYTREDWGQPDQASIFSDEPSDISPTIDFVFRDEGEVWGADDDTDIEYIYQHLLFTNETSMLSGEQIRDGWLEHIKHEEENFLWVSNQTALNLMLEGEVPPATSDPELNPNFEMIDAQLTTEIFGLYAPVLPGVALEMAHLPIRTTARENAAWISEFYVIMHSLASRVDESLSMKEKVMWMAEQASNHLPADSYSSKMYDFVKHQYESGVAWEEARDNLYQRYQVEEADGYDVSSREPTCGGCFAAGINFGASLVSLFYGEGDLKETIKIGALAGWDSDNPTATWAGLLGFMLGKDGVEDTFGRTFSDRYNIHRTRQNFPDDGIDTFDNMAEKGVFIVDRVVQKQMGGGIDLEKNVWYIPNKDVNITEATED